MSPHDVVTPDSPLAPHIGIGMPLAEVVHASPEHLESLVIAHLRQTPDHPAREDFLLQLEDLDRQAGPLADTTRAATLLARDHIADTVSTVQHLAAQLAA